MLMKDAAKFFQSIKPETESFVLDAEAVAWDKDDSKILPFQELSRRKRKDVKAEDIKVKVHIFAFDLLYVNGEVSYFERAVPRLVCIDSDMASSCAGPPAKRAYRTAPASAGALYPGGRPICVGEICGCS